jgi:hypothetical protein
MTELQRIENALNYTRGQIEEMAAKIAAGGLKNGELVRLANEMSEYAGTLVRVEEALEKEKKAIAKAESEAKKAAALKESGIGVIDVFLEEFKQKEIAWFMAMKDLYFSDYAEFREQRRTGEISKTVALIITENSREGIIELIDREIVKRRYKLLQAINKKAGEIVDAKLVMNPNGGFDGTVTGTDAVVTISTIVAGGYNIQRAHYRTLVQIAR